MRNPNPAMSVRRQDPPSRSPDSVRDPNIIKNGDPRRRYTFTNPNDEGDTGLQAYLSDGWRIEVKSEGGPQLTVGKAPGDGESITYRGQVLVSIAIEEWEERHKAGQKRVDLVEERIVKNRGGIDALRGIAGVYDVLNETEKERVAR